MSESKHSDKKSLDPITEKKDKEEIAESLHGNSETASKNVEDEFQTPIKIPSKQKLKEKEVVADNETTTKYDEQRKFIFNFYPSPFQFQKNDELSPIPQVDNGLNGIWNIAHPAFYNYYKNIEIKSCPYIFTNPPGIKVIFSSLKNLNTNLKSEWMHRRIYNANRMYLFLMNFKVSK